MALRTRLRISREADSDGPTTWKLGSPEVRWTSTVTAGAHASLAKRIDKRNVHRSSLISCCRLPAKSVSWVSV